VKVVINGATILSGMNFSAYIGRLTILVEWSLLSAVQ